MSENNKVDWHKVFDTFLQLLSYITLLCAIAMSVFLIRQHFGLSAGETPQPAAFFTHILCKDESNTDYYLLQWTTVIAMFAVGIRVMNKKIIGSIFGIYCLISIFIPVLFIPIQILGALIALYLLFFLAINCLGLFGLLKVFGIRTLPGFPGLKKLFNYKA